jgi:peptidoglycan/LPS O-acetylase OafA/YrhL
MKKNTELIYITRFIAAISVVIYHFMPKNISFSYIIRNNNEAVNYFFFISGFVMILASHKYIHNDLHHREFSKLEFWIKRISRIYPLYLFALIMLLFFHYFIKTIEIPNIGYRLPFEIVAIQRWLYARSINFPDWTISCEFLFYLFFPYLLIYIHKNPLKYTRTILSVFFLSIIINISIHNIREFSMNDQWRRIVGIINQHPILKFPTFALGSLCGLKFSNGFFDRIINSNRTSLILAGSCILIIIFALYNTPIDYLFDSGLLAIVYFVFIPSICGIRVKDTKFFKVKWMIFLGDISYGIYIMQYPVMLFYRQYISVIDSVGQLGIFILVLIFVSSLTFKMLEFPLKTLVMKLYYARNNKVNT